MKTSASQLLREVLERFEAMDVDGIVDRFAPGALLFDPHYPPPVGPAMAGHEAIRAGLTLGLGMLEQPGFTVRHELAGASESLAAVEVDTRHRLAGGTVVSFPQVFVAEMGDDGLLRRLQSYTPYPPPAPVM